MKISVIIPCYNAEATISNALGSVSLQSYPAFETIVINDGSSDGSAGVVQSFGRGVRLIDQANAGVSSARNRGIQAAKGDYVAFLDADDVWHQEFLSTIKKMHDAMPDAVMFCTFRKLFDVDSGNYAEIPNVLSLISTNGVNEQSPMDYKNFLKLYAVCDLIQTSSVVGKRSALLELGGFNEDMIIAEDVDLWAALSMQGTICYSPRELTTQNASGLGAYGKYSVKKIAKGHFYNRFVDASSPLSRDVDSICAEFYVTRRLNVVFYYFKGRNWRLGFQEYFALVFNRYCIYLKLRMFAFGILSFFRLA